MTRKVLMRILMLRNLRGKSKNRVKIKVGRMMN